MVGGGGSEEYTSQPRPGAVGEGTGRSGSGEAVAPCLQKTSRRGTKGYVSQGVCWAAATTPVVGQSCAWPARGGGICRGTDTWGLLPVGGSVWFTLSWLMVMVFAVVIVDIRELAG